MGLTKFTKNLGKSIQYKILPAPTYVFAQDVHAKRVYSLANATLGVITSASLAVHLIGQGLAQARDGLRKHAIKQVDRLLSNAKLDVWELFRHWVPYVVSHNNGGEPTQLIE